MSAEKPTLPERIGSVHTTGLPSFDCDSIANDAPNQWRWLSLPESRLVLNPTASDDFAPLPPRPDLPLHVAYAGQRDGPPHAWGVKPSLFGAVQMIDFTCMNNGARLDQGLPLEIRWPLDTASRPAEADRKDK